MKRLTVLFCIWLSSLLPAFAGRISMESQVRTTVRGQGLEAVVTVTNRGDESAHQVQLKAEIPGSTAASPLQPALPVGKSYSYTFHHSLKGISPGRYLHVTRVLYADANLYPFSALSLSSFVHQKDAPPDVLGVLDKAEIVQRGRLTLKLKNLTGDERNLTVRVLLPQELSLEHPLPAVKLLPFQEQTLAIEIRNFSALAGSTYPVYAVAEYDLEGLHYSVPALGTVQIKARGAAPRFLDRYLAPMALLLVAAIVFLNVRSFRKKK